MSPSVEQSQEHSSSRCPVCGCALGLDPEVCSHCGTPHDKECWEYAGGCAVFACRASPGMRRSDPAARPDARPLFEAWYSAFMVESVVLTAMLVGIAAAPVSLFISVAMGTASPIERSGVIGLVLSAYGDHSILLFLGCLGPLAAMRVEKTRFEKMSTRLGQNLAIPEKWAAARRIVPSPSLRHITSLFTIFIVLDILMIGVLRAEEYSFIIASPPDRVIQDARLDTFLLCFCAALTSIGGKLNLEGRWAFLDQLAGKPVEKNSLSLSFFTNWAFRLDPRVRRGGW